MHLVGFTIEIYHDALPYKRQKWSTLYLIYKRLFHRIIMKCIVMFVLAVFVIEFFLFEGMIT